MTIDQRISLGAKGLWQYLAAMDIKGKRGAFPSQKVMCLTLGVSKPTLNKLIAELMRIGVLTKESRYGEKGQITNLYHVKLPEQCYPQSVSKNSLHTQSKFFTHPSKNSLHVKNRKSKEHKYKEGLTPLTDLFPNIDEYKRP